MVPGYLLGARDPSEGLDDLADEAQNVLDLLQGGGGVIPTQQLVNGALQLLTLLAVSGTLSRLGLVVVLVGWLGLVLGSAFFSSVLVCSVCESRESRL